MTVVYFDQHLCAVHPKGRSKSSFLTFLMPKRLKKQKKRWQGCAELLKMQNFFPEKILQPAFWCKWKNPFFCKILLQISCFLRFFSFIVQNMLKIKISTSVWSAQYLNAGQDIQQMTSFYTFRCCQLLSGLIFLKVHY